MPINLYNTQIEELIIHQIGNKCRGEGVFWNDHNTFLSDEITPLVKEFFFKPFREKEETWYQFVHEADLEHHIVNTMVKMLFDNLNLLSFSQNIGLHMYDQSNHPHVKPGEVYIARLSNVILNDEKVNAIGIFKSELKHDFIQFEKSESQLEILLQQGISLSKLDKGAIIIDRNQEEGYQILSIDSNKYDTKYWLQNVLGVDLMIDENFYTKKYLKFCHDFSKDVVRAAGDKKDELLFMNKAIIHFGTHDVFHQDEFLTEVLEDSEFQAEFDNYKLERGPKYGIEDLTSFAISNSAIKAATANFKSVIELDTNVSLKMNFINAESFEKFVEKGWDEERQMYYYLVYFNGEKK